MDTSEAEMAGVEINVRMLPGVQGTVDEHRIRRRPSSQWSAERRAAYSRGGADRGRGGGGGAAMTEDPQGRQTSFGYRARKDRAPVQPAPAVWDDARCGQSCASRLRDTAFTHV
ncbi:hypothetical protein HPB50_024595 [Hyalomma asiaticum]|uniref:Uncharacterized protein n=1 Tax=Hyalomma asiaticum TaxID=266040 RepID=A0ACB7RMY1_HYAAI|nr:hypothetical protein HPB50_024595 [Hyalomma asiaticum]